MSANAVFVLVACLALAVHLAVLVWVLRAQTGIHGLLCVNVAVAGLVLAYQLSRAQYILRPPVDRQQLALAGFEALAVASAAWAYGGHRLPGVIAYAVFGLHLFASAAAVLFVLTVRFDRMM